MYPIQLTVTVHNSDQLQSVMDVLAGRVNVVSARVTAVEQAPVEVKAKITTEKAEPVAQTVVVSPEEWPFPGEKDAAAATAAPQAPEAPAELPYEQVQTAFRKFINSKGRDAAAGILTGLGLSTLKDANPVQLREIHSIVTKVAA